MNNKLIVLSTVPILLLDFTAFTIKWTYYTKFIALIAFPIAIIIVFTSPQDTRYTIYSEQYLTFGLSRRKE